jgi:hypothetical protein
MCAKRANQSDAAGASSSVTRAYWLFRERSLQRVRAAVLLATESLVQIATWLAFTGGATRILLRRLAQKAGSPPLSVEGRRLVLISYFAPPYKSLHGTQRWSKFLKFLHRQGWQLALVTTEAPAEEADVGAERLPAGVEVLSLPAHRLRHPRHTGGGRAVPDRYVSWTRKAASAATELVRRIGPSVIVATAPPYSNLLAGVLAAGRTGMPFVADFRDPWTRIDCVWRVSGGARRLVNRCLERLCLGAADRIVIADPKDYLRDFFGRVSASVARRTVAIHNGYDEEDFTQVVPDCTLLRGPRFVISYVGSIYDRETLDNLLEPLRRWRSEAPSEVDNVLFMYAGSGTYLVDPVAFPCALASLGYVSHHEAIRLRMSSHVQLFSQPEHFKAHVMSGKIYEILRCGVTVLARTRKDGAVAKLIRRAGAGYVVPQHDHAGAVSILRKLYRMWRANELSGSTNLTQIRGLERSEQAVALSGLLDELVGLRSSSAVLGPSACSSKRELHNAGH